MGYDDDLDQIDQDTYDEFLIFLEDEEGLAKSTIRNYKKALKKFFAVITNGDTPRWVDDLKLKNHESPVQPSDILTTDEEVNKLMDTCKHPRNKALIAIMLDSGMRVGALGSMRIKDVEFNDYGGVLYISKTSKAKKTTKPKGIPITWSTGHLNQWLNVHPKRNDPNAPLWTTLTEPHTALSYKTIRQTVKSIAEKAGISKKVTPHSLRHKAITNWILDGLSEQEVKHRAGWSRGSNQMLEIYGNFTDQEMHEQIYEHYGLKTEDKRPVTLERCPRCNNTLQKSDRFCSQCSLALDQETAEVMEEVRAEISNLLGLEPNEMIRLKKLLDKTG